MTSTSQPRVWRGAASAEPPSTGGAIVTSVAHREAIPEAIHVTGRYANNRAEQSLEATRVRERGMRKFKSVRQAQRFVTTHAAVSKLIKLERHLVRGELYRNPREGAFAERGRAVA
jgi:putative transposase